MNQKFVWYPLFNRDDSQLDSNLKSILTRNNFSSSSPILSVVENEVINNLKTATKITDDIDKIYAIKLSGHFGQQYMWRTKALRDLTMVLLPERVNEMNTSVSSNMDPSELFNMNNVPMITGNRLSPNAAVIANILKSNYTNLNSAFSLASDKYMAWFKGDQTGACRSYYWLWTPSFDDKVISNVGNCNVEALNMTAAIVDAKISDWDVWLANWWQYGYSLGHVITGVYNKFTKEGYQFSNGEDAGIGPLNSQAAYVNFVRYINEKYIMIGLSQVEDYFKTNQPYTNQLYQDVENALNDMQNYNPNFKISRTSFQSFPREMYSPADYIKKYVSEYKSTWQVFNYNRNTNLIVKPIPLKPQILAPSRGDKPEQPNYFKIIWNKVNYADAYDFNISNEMKYIKTVFDERVNEVANISDTSICSKQLSNYAFSSNTKFYYRVRAKNSSGFSNYTIDSLITGPDSKFVQAFEPEMNKVILTKAINFKWSSNYYTPFYQLYINKDIFRGWLGTKLYNVYADSLVKDTLYTINAKLFKEGRKYYWTIVFSYFESYNGTEPSSFIIPLSPPKNLLTSNEGKQIKLQWTNINDSELWVFIERKEENGNYTIIDSVRGNFNTFSDYKIKEGINYSYRIFSQYNFGTISPSKYQVNSERSNECTLKSLSSVIYKPSDLVVINRTNKAELRWLDNSENEIGFIIQRKFNKSQFITIDTVNTTKFIDSLFIGGKYYYRIYAYNELGISDYSNVDSTTIISSILDDQNLPIFYALSQNYPNPFNPTTQISFDIPKQTYTELTVYDILGKEVSVLASGQYSPGKYVYSFDATNLPSGIYFYHINAGEFQQTKKMLLIK